MNAYRSEIRRILEYAPPAAHHNPKGPIAWIGVPGTLCQACASRVIGRGCGSELRTLSPIYSDNAPEAMQACFGCGLRAEKGAQEA